MSGRILIGVILLGSLGLSSGCFRPYYGHRYPTGYAVRNNPRAYYTGVGLSCAGNAVLRAASRQGNPGVALAAAAVGLGLHAAAAGNYYDAATVPRRYSYRRHHYRCTPRYGHYYDSYYYDYR